MTAEAVTDALTIAQAKPGLLAKTSVTKIASEDGAVVLTLSEPFAALPAYLAHYSAQIFAPAA